MSLKKDKNDREDFEEVQAGINDLDLTTEQKTFLLNTC